MIYPWHTPSHPTGNPTLIPAVAPHIRTYSPDVFGALIHAARVAHDDDGVDRVHGVGVVLQAPRCPPAALVGVLRGPVRPAPLSLCFWLFRGWWVDPPSSFGGRGHPWLATSSGLWGWLSVVTLVWLGR